MVIDLPKSRPNPSLPARPLMFSYSAHPIGVRIMWSRPSASHFCVRRKTVVAGRLTPMARVVVQKMTLISPFRAYFSMTLRSSLDRSA
jgi:hypothetical protein